jgi:E3 ubiquitin-protein ligase RNF168
MSSIKTKSNKNDRLKLSDCTCPICLEITIQPVDMPCKHEICLKCFDTMIDQTNLCCPMCRLNIGDWSRQARLTNRLINIEKWKLIKESFPVEIKNRLEGKQTDILNETTVHVKCARKGEIRKEYLDLIKRVSTIGFSTLILPHPGLI